MDDKSFANQLFPHLTLTKEDLEKRYPERVLNEGSMVTRFAPSPTGFLHLGSLYTAFVARTYAKQSGGVFYLRIEDTDQKREVQEGVSNIIQDLNHYDLVPDEGPTFGGSYGPYLQSERKEIYQVMAKFLVEKGLAYPCFCSSQTLEQMRIRQEEQKERLGYYGSYACCRNLSKEEMVAKLREGSPYVLRFRATGSFDHKWLFHDEIKGDIMLPENEMDIVLLKQDGLPTYHFAHVVDDYLMHTTHVIRGDEWLSSIPIHYALAEALEIPVCHYAHLAPLTIKEGESVRKLSKRKDRECALSYYEGKGIPKEVLELYFASILNPDFEQAYEDKKTNEFFFSFSKMSVGGTLLDLDKITSIGKTYFSRMTNGELYQGTLAYADEYDPTWAAILKDQKDYALQVFDIERGTEKTRKDIACYMDVKEEYAYLFDAYFEQLAYEPNVLGNRALLKSYETIYRLEDSEEEWLEKIKELGEQYGYARDRKAYKQDPSKYQGQFGDVCGMIRYAISGRTKTPNLYYLLKVLGTERICLRIEKYIKYLQKRFPNA